jgi:ATP-binding cassette, subfamily F, member 3
LISLSNISVQFSGNYLFEDVSFIINRRDRIGLVGKNGAGKTTLMKVITGQMAPEMGTVAVPSGAKVGYLPQEMKLRSKQSVMEEALHAFDEVQQLEKQIHKLTAEITSRTDYESDEYHELTQQLADGTERLAMLDGATREARAEKVLLGLGFLRSDLMRPMSEFSGGWQMRVELAKILLKSPELLLLDEPTNHLDIESIQWLEQFLSEYPGAVMLISHDRAFLDNITERTIEISMGKIYDYKVCYSDYELLRQERLGQEMAAYSTQQKEIAQVERFITRFRAKNTKAKQVKSKIKMLEKMEKVEVETLDTSSIHFRFPEPPPSGKVVIEANHISKSYGSHEVLKDLNFMVARGERIAFVGRNGEGKTTLSRIIIGELDHQGKMIPGHQVKIGYYAQNQSEYLDPEKTVFETMDDAARGEIRKQTRNILGGFMFGGEDIDKKVKVLSGGEKSRLAIARLLLEPVNLLVLDEPTNHLDMRSKDILKSALLQYGGTMIVVSHDRDFLQGLTNKVYEFRQKKIREFIGDIYDFIDARRIDSLSQLELKDKNSGKSTSGYKNHSDSENKISWEQKKQYERDLRKIENKISKVESEMERLETAIKRLEGIIANPTLDQKGIEAGTIFASYEKAKKDLAKQESLWEAAHIELEHTKMSS